MPRRIIAKAKANLFMTMLLIVGAVVVPTALGFAYIIDCNKQDAADNAEVLVADNAAWKAVEDILNQDANSETIETLREAVHNRVALAQDLNTSEDTFC